MSHRTSDFILIINIISTSLTVKKNFFSHLTNLTKLKSFLDVSLLNSLSEFCVNKPEVNNAAFVQKFFTTITIKLF